MLSQFCAVCCSLCLYRGYKRRSEDTPPKKMEIQRFAWGHMLIACRNRAVQHVYRICQITSSGLENGRLSLRTRVHIREASYVRRMIFCPRENAQRGVPIFENDEGGIVLLFDIMFDKEVVIRWRSIR